MRRLNSYESVYWVDRRNRAQFAIVGTNVTWRAPSSRGLRDRSAVDYLFYECVYGLYVTTLCLQAFLATVFSLSMLNLHAPSYTYKRATSLARSVRQGVAEFALPHKQSPPVVWPLPLNFILRLSLLFRFVYILFLT